MFLIKKIQLNHQTQQVGVSEWPKISWELLSDKKDVVQTRYQIQISDKSNFESTLYDSLFIQSNKSINVKLLDISCEDFTKYFIRVRAENNYEEITDWATKDFVMGYASSNCNSSMITIEDEVKLEENEAFYLRKQFELEKHVEEIYCAATAFGLYNLYFNGKKASDYLMTPGWTSFKNNLMYQVYDIKNFVTEGTNTLGAIIGAGWYKGTFGFNRVRDFYGDKTGFLCEIHIKYSDGRRQVLGTDSTWKGHIAPIQFSHIYDGEIYDTRKEVPRWNENEGDETDWVSCSVIDFDKKILRAQICEPVKVIDEFAPKKVFKTPKDETIIDFGQNMSGTIKISAEGKKGDNIELICFEVLDKDGNVYLDNLRSAKQTIRYTFGDSSEIEYVPSFTFQGFRYAYIKQFPSNPKPDNFVGMAISSGMEQTGYFESSNEDVNQLMHNILWGLNSNFVDIPTDCPQRDERLGWTGDAQIFARTACFLKNCYGFYSKYLVDLAFDQTENGGVPHVVPDILTGHCDDDVFMSQGTHSATGWADAAVIIPWTLYQVYADKEILYQQYESMKSWIDFMINHSKDFVWEFQLQFGDWVALDAEEGSYFGATPNEMMCAAYAAYSTGLFINTLKILNRNEEAEYYQQYLDGVVNQYRKTYFDKDGHMTVQTQTAHIVSLYFGLVEENHKQVVTDGLIKLLKKEDGHLVTGFLGTPYFCTVLTQNGKIKEAYDLFLRDDFPSWLYQVKMGATTVWEHWDGIKPDGSMWSADMNSFNHYAYGAIGEWIQRSMIGIEIDASKPGYEHFYISPVIDDRFTFVKGKLITQFGAVESIWEYKDGICNLKIQVPVNTKCTVILTQAKDILSSDVGTFKHSNKGLMSNVGSGDYSITFSL